MNILHIISCPAAGGAEIYVKDLSRILSERGHAVHIAFVNHAEDLGHDKDFERQFLADLDANGVPYFFVDKRRWWSPWRGISVVNRYVREHGIDVCHSHLTVGIIYGAFSRRARIYTHHNIRMRVDRWLFRLIASGVDELVGISSTCTKALELHSGRRVTCIFNGVDRSRIGGSTKRCLRPGEVMNCIAVGRICSQKAYPVLVDAIGSMEGRYRGLIKVRIIGDGDQDDVAALNSKIANSGLSDIIELTGPSSDVPSILASSNVFLMSSDYEGLPIALIEATVVGLPVVVTDVGGCKEVVDACGNGFVVQAGDSEGLKSAITELLENPERVEELSGKAIKNGGQFLIDAAVDAHIALYENLVRHD